MAKMKLALHDGHEAAGLRGFTQCNINETVQLSMMDFNDTDSLRTYAKVDICSRIRIVE